MNDGFDDRVRAVFAVLPHQQAGAAASEMVQRYLGAAPADTELPWLDVDAHGAILRGGITHVGDRSTRIIADPARSADLAALADVAAAADVTPAGQIVASERGDCFYWFAPSPRGGEQGATVVRGLAIRPDAFSTLLDRFDPGRGVTPAEKRTLFQLVAGWGPREAAEADGVSFETKRAQLKSLCAKLHCSGQTDLVRRMVGQLVHLLYLTESGAADARGAEEFARAHLPPSIRLTIQSLDNGRVLRAFECGPPTGRPVLIAHGMLFPIVLLNASAACERLGLRLIMPIRSGYLDDQSAAAMFREIDRDADVDDIALYAARFGERVPVVGHSLGASWALRFARRHPRRVERLVLLSPTFLGDRRSSSVFGSFLDGLKALTARPGLLRYIAWQFRKQFLDERVLRQAWRRICGESADDLAVLDGRRGAGPIYGWFEAGYRSSVGGVADDMAGAGGSWREELADLPCPITMIAGPSDPVAGYATDWQAVSATPGVTLVRLPAGGHLVAASHADSAWMAVAHAIAPVAATLHVANG